MAQRILVWFKRDLREEDHLPLARAARVSQEGAEVLGLWLIEPQWLASAEFDPQHLAFALDCVRPLRDRLARKGFSLCVWRADALEALERIHQVWPFDTLISHEETGPGWTWTRDRAVAAWCRTRSIHWIELPQTGVIRRLRDRRGWAGRWQARMTVPVSPIAEHYRSPSAGLPSCWDTQTLEALDLRPAVRRPMPPGGEASANEALSSFLARGAAGYRANLSSPLTAPLHCSRLSAHLSFGTLSIRKVFQETGRAMADTDHAVHRQDLRSFASRLRWHCHFMQKLEDEPQIEWRNFMRACDGLRHGDPSITTEADDLEVRQRLEAWQAGCTGFPMVDACMRMLNATGWINFRMRAMLVSFAAYHLWLHWRTPGEHLARQFLDFEPGIHWSQMQMQSGTTGINTLRIYSPAKQAQDQDPTGAFIRQWVPEIGTRNYPVPIVEERAALARAREVMFGLRRQATVRAQADEIQARHGSRRSGLPPSSTRAPGRRRAAPAGSVQGELFDPAEDTGP